MTDPDALNAFESDMLPTAARTKAEAAVEQLRVRGGVFVEAVRATRMAMVLTDPALPGNPIVFANESFLTLSGYNRDEVRGQQPYFLNGPDTHPRDAARFRQALAEDHDETLHTIQYRKDGSRMVVSLFLTALKDDDGRTLYHLLSWRDISRQTAAEEEVDALRETQAALRESEQRYRRVFSNNMVPMAVWAKSGDIAEANDALLELLGYTRAELDAGKLRWDEITPAQYRELDIQALAEVEAKGFCTPYEKVFCHKDGSPIPIIIGGGSLDEKAGTGVLFAFDITERRRVEMALHESEQHQRLLLAELQHRVRNVLAMVRSVVRRTQGSYGDVDDYVRHLDGRLSSLARVQAILTRESGRGVNLQNLVLDELASQVAAPAQYRIEGPEVELSPKVAELLGLAVHELATNSTKYGVLSGSSGTIRVRWTTDERDGRTWLRWTWHESVGSTANRPTRTGFGTDLIQNRVPYELHGTGNIIIGNDAVEATIDFPLSDGGSMLETAAADRDMAQ